MLSKDKSELKKIRNELITYLYKKVNNLTVGDLAFLFHLTEETIKIILRQSNINPSSDSNDITPERRSHLVTVVDRLSSKLKESYNLNDDDIIYIFKNNECTDKLGLYLLTYLKDENDIRLENLQLKQEISDLGAINHSLKQENNCLEHRNTDLKTINIILNEKITKLKQNIDFLERKNDDLEAKNNSLKKDLSDLEERNTFLENEETKTTVKNLTLSNETYYLKCENNSLNQQIKELQSQLKNYDGLSYQTELAAKESEIKILKAEKNLLEEEKESLKRSIEAKDKELDDSIKFLTPIQKQQIVDYYVSHNFRLTKKNLEEFISTTGIQISDNGFRFICKQKNVYRRKKKKKK